MSYLCSYYISFTIFSFTSPYPYYFSVQATIFQNLSLVILKVAPNLLTSLYLSLFTLGLPKWSLFRPVGGICYYAWPSQGKTSKSLKKTYPPTVRMINNK